MDVEKSCIAPFCGDGELNGTEECDKTEFKAEFLSPEATFCPDGTHKGSLKCSDSCRVDIAESCLDNPAELLITQIGYMEPRDYYTNDGPTKIGGESFVEITNVGKGRQSDQCGLFWASNSAAEGAPAVWEPSKLVYSFPEKVGSGESILVCSNEFETQKTNDPMMQLPSYSLLLEKCEGHIAEAFRYEADRDALGVFCGNSAADVTEMNVQNLKSVEILLKEPSYPEVHARRRCDKLTPFSDPIMLNMNKISSTDWAKWLGYYEPERISSKFFAEDMGKFTCSEMDPVLSQITAGYYENDSYLAVEIANVGIGSEHGMCALYYYSSSPYDRDKVFYAVKKLTDLPDIDPFQVYTICSESTKAYVDSLNGAQANLTLPCNLYLSDDIFNLAQIAPGAGSYGISCNSIEIPDPSTITENTESLQIYGDTFSIDIVSPETQIRAIRPCEKLVKDESIFNLSIGGNYPYTGAFSIILDSEDPRLVKDFADDFGKLVCPKNAVEPIRCGDHIRTADEECDGEVDYYTVTHFNDVGDICKAWDSDYLTKEISFGHSTKDTLFCKDDCTLDREKSCTTCKNGKLDEDKGEYCDSYFDSERGERITLWTSIERIAAYCEQYGQVLKEEYKKPGAEMPSSINCDNCNPAISTFCTKCGNGKLDDSETCDGSAIDKTRCDNACKNANYSKPYCENTITCTSECKVDTSNSCWDGRIN